MKKQEFLKQYQTKEWYEISKRIKARDNNTCQMCGCNDKPLNVHHLCYGEDGSIFVDDNCLITLCEQCHQTLHADTSSVDWLLEELKGSFTSIEIRYILEEVMSKYSTFYTLHPKSIPSKGVWMKKSLGNLKKWRVRINKEGFVKKILSDYYSALYKERDTSKIKEFFQKEIGMSIEDYVVKNKTLCENQKRKVFELKKKIEAGIIPF
jgi:hypothetical protein